MRNPSYKYTYFIQIFINGESLIKTDALKKRILFRIIISVRQPYPHIFYVSAYGFTSMKMKETSGKTENARLFGCYVHHHMYGGVWAHKISLNSCGLIFAGFAEYYLSMYFVNVCLY